MTLETANRIFRDKSNLAEMTGIELALLAIIRNLQVRHVEALERIERLESRNSKGREAPEPECRCYCVGDQADASDCELHGGNR